MTQVFTAIITPFQTNGEIDYNLFEELVNWQTRIGIDGLVVCGTNGEFASLSLEEVKSLLKFTFDIKQEELLIIAGTGRSSLKETIELCKISEELADMALVVPPFYFKVSEIQGLYNYFKQLLENTEIPVVLYNIPKYSGITIPTELLMKLKDYENLVGVKDSSGQIESMESFIKTSPDLSVFGGSDALIYPSFEMGAKGCISAISTIFPEEVLEIKISYLAEQKDAAQTAQEKILTIRNTIKQFPNRAVFKSALSLLGFPRSFVRPPLVDLTEEQEGQLKNRLSPFISQ